ncbi:MULTISPECIES: TolC family protein [Hydrocarboniphaga]|uniref:TolC family protein n=1 Tax=Hydrocarboniphaga TaxID=243627 RepID=UPI0002F3EE55|nr:MULTISPECIES: TolC family protein [Hydrocarboniphaga]MDZ4078615.1 TolC family protein [Hydrocarboniphaga sp.]
MKRLGHFQLPVTLCLCLTTASAPAQPTTSSTPAAPSRRAEDLPESPDALELATSRCGRPGSDSPLTLLDATRRALCANPRTRQAWASIEAQRAALGAQKAEYWPTVTAGAALGRVTADSRFPDNADFNSSFSGTSNELRLDVNWLLFDFGVRNASVSYEAGLLTAATASLERAVQTVFLETAETYFEAQAAFAALNSATQAEQLAREVFEVVQTKVGAGVGLESDRLQARTAWAQASLDRVSAERRSRAALGVLAVALHFRPNVSLILAPLPSNIVQTAEALPEIEALIGRALNANPGVLAARARLEAARRAERVAQAAGRPRISLVAVGVRSDTPVDRVATRQTIETTSVGVQLSVPIFDGHRRRSRIQQSHAEALDRDAELFSASRQVERDVWDSYVGIRSNWDELAVCRELVDAADASYALALGRYKSGVGTILELMSAQASLASARTQQSDAISREQLMRVRLAAALGVIDSTP